MLPETLIQGSGALAAVCAMFLAILVPRAQAFSLDEMYSPHAEYREFAVEYDGARSFDPQASKNFAQVGETTLEAGVTPSLTLAMSGEYSRAPGSSLQLVANQVEARYQFTEPGDKWVDSGMLLDYDFSRQNGAPDMVESKLLLEKDTGRYTHTANVGFTQSLGVAPGYTGGPDYTVMWNTRYRYNIYFQPGIELQSDLGQGSTRARFNAQEHYVGPAVYGKLFGHLRYQVAYFAGISDAASRNAARAVLEYEMPF